jgi:CelD/BcsL family acetyltransferase involved in cellulose biosynthesis
MVELAAEVVSRVEDLELIEADWRELRQSQGVWVPNTDPDRFLATLGPQSTPHVLAVREGDSLRALLVARRATHRLSHRLGYARLSTPLLRSLVVVYSGFMSNDDLEATQCIADHLGELLESREVHHVMLNRLPLEHPAHDLLVRRGAVRQGREPHWRVGLVAGSFDESMAQHSSKHRRQLRRFDRKLDRHFAGDSKLRVVCSAREVPELLGMASRVSAETYQAALGVGVQDDPQTRAVLTTEAEKGRLRAYVLLGGGEPLAFQVGMLYGSAFFCSGRGYLPAFRDLRPGTVLFMRMMQDLCEQGA